MVCPRLPPRPLQHRLPHLPLHRLLHLPPHLLLPLHLPSKR